MPSSNAFSTEREGEKAVRSKEILGTLKTVFSIPEISKMDVDPFRVLTRTIISQSTAEVNTRRAYENLSARMPITPKSLAEADVKDIEDALKVAGLYRNKSVILKKVSTIILEKFNGSLNFIYSLPLEEARKELIRLPGVGPKTADIVLLFCAGRPVLPVDTHVNRVSKRLGLVPKSYIDYEDVRATLEKLYEPSDYFAIHMLFISLGRGYCKAAKPLCSICPLKTLCPSAEI